MIQRIQSIYLLLTTLLSLLFLNGSFLSFINKSGSIIKITFNGILKSTAGQDFEYLGKVLPLSIIILLIPVLSIITISFFKNRIIQLWLARILIGVITFFILVSAYYSYSVATQYNGQIMPGVKIILPFLILIFSILAFRGIRKDDKLVKSYDRLR
ncbi:MAG: DUF4293 family protein [Bacteroidales bacterium]